MNKGFYLCSKYRTMEKDFFKEGCVSITVCDCEGIVLYQNDKSKQVNGDVVGKNLFGCHNPNSQAIIHRLIDGNETNSYTISKKGQKKLIYQTPWYNDGKVAGLIEYSLIIPEEMPHYVRS